MKNSSFFLILCLILLMDSTYSDYVNIKSNRAVTIGTPIKFQVTVSHPNISQGFEYHFAFEQFPENNKILTSENATIQYLTSLGPLNSPLPDHPLDSMCGPTVENHLINHTVKVDVWHRAKGVPSVLIGTAEAHFSLMDSIMLCINLNQDIFTSGWDTYSVAYPISFVTYLHDPNKFFETLDLTYEWFLEDEVIQEGPKNFYVRKFSKSRAFNVSLIVLAKNSSIQKYGYAEALFETKDPVQDLTAVGKDKVNLANGENVTALIEIGKGSPPFHCCWYIWGKLDPSCQETNETRLLINFPFEEKGEFELTIDVSNAVSRNFTSHKVKIYENISSKLKPEHHDFSFLHILAEIYRKSTFSSVFNPIFT